MIRTNQIIARGNDKVRNSQAVGAAVKATVDALEERTMFAMLGIQPGFPNVTWNNTGVASYVYDAGTNTGTFTVTATPLRFKATELSPQRLINAPKDFKLQIKLDASGNLLGGVDGNDFEMTGSIDANLDGIVDYEGVLLSGEIAQFGWADVSPVAPALTATDLFDFRLHPTGGALLALYGPGTDIASSMSSENSNFDGDFTKDSQGHAKGNTGPTAALRARLGDFVWHDVDADGVQDLGEPGIGGVKLNLNGTDLSGNPVAGSMLTNPDGSYLFDNLPLGTYRVTVDASNFSGPLSGYAASPILQGGDATKDSNPSPTAPVSFPSGGEDLTLDFGFIKLSSIAGNVYHDKDNDGLFDAAELGIGAVKVTLTGTNDIGQIVNAFVLTKPDGSYKFEGLRPGTYQIDEEQPAAFLDGKDTIGTPGGDTANDQFSHILLPAGFDGVENNFGEVLPPPPLGSLSGKKFKDLTGNGLTPDDTPLGGVTVQLYLDKNGDGKLDSGDKLLATDVTDAGGAYSFDGLADAEYLVKEIVPTGWIRTAPTLSDYHAVEIKDADDTTNLHFANFMKCCTGDVTNIKYTIKSGSSTKTVTDLRGQVKQGDKVTVKFTVTSQTPITLTLVSYTAPGSTFVASEADEQDIYQKATGTFTAGTYELCVMVPDCYFQVDFVCGEAIDRFGPANSNIFYTPQGRLISADNGGTKACCTPTPGPGTGSLSGFVFHDKDNDGYFDSNESPIAGATVTLTGTNDVGQTVTMTRVTAANGSYSFTQLRAGTYAITETQPAGYTDGKEQLGSRGGTVSNDKFSTVKILAGQSGVNYNFGEILIVVNKKLVCGDTATIGYWCNKNGQALLKSLNGSQNAKNLGNWMAATYPKLFGMLGGKTNCEIAELFKWVKGNSGMKLEAQIMATAFAVYVTNSTLAGNAAADDGFNVSSTGTGAKTISVGSNGAAFGVANNATITVHQALLAANNSVTGNGLYNGSWSLKSMANDVFTAINETGDRY